MKKMNRLQEWESLVNELVILSQSGHYAQAADLAQEALTLAEKYLSEIESARSLNYLAEINHLLGNYSNVESQLLRALDIREKHFGAQDSELAPILHNLADLYEAQGNYIKAEHCSLRALSIREKEFGNDHPNIASNLYSLAELYRAQGHYLKAETVSLRALAICENTLENNHPEVAASLNNLAGVYRFQGNNIKAEPLFLRALSIWQHALGTDHPTVAICLNNLACLYYVQTRYAEAEPLFLRALEIREKSFLPDHPKVVASLNNIAELYRVQRQYTNAEYHYRRALAICRSSYDPEYTQYHSIFICQGLASLYQATFRTMEALELYQQVWTLIEGDARHRRDIDARAFDLALDQLTCWNEMQDAEGWAKQMSHILRDRLNLVLETNRAKWVSDLHSKFLRFHVKWVQQYLLHERHVVPIILSLVSGWRMGQAILDEQVRDDPSKPEPLRRFCRLRRELDQLRQKIDVIAKQVADPVRAVALSATYAELKHLYDHKYEQVMTAQDNAAQYPEFAALGSDFGSYGEQLRFRLNKGEAIAFLVDFPEQNFRGVLLQTRNDAQWFDIGDLAEGMNGLHYFNGKYAKGRGFRGSQSRIAREAEEPVPPAFLEGIPAHRHAEQFWLAFGQWIEEQLWLPLKDALQEQNITHLYLITQGRTHSLPWEMNAPANLRLSRFPNGALFAMHKGLVPRPQSNYIEDASTNVPSLGLAASVDSDIPCAAMEIELVKNLWTGTIHSPYDYLSPPPEGVVAGHFSGHGVHRDDTPQQAYLEMGSTPWTVPEMMSSRIHPKRIFLSACVAGRTTETGEGDLYGFVTGLMQCGVQELSAATLNMDDMWMLALAINVQRRLHDDPKLTQGEALAQAKIALGKGELVTQEVKQAWFNALMSKKMGFDRNVVSMLRNLDQAREQDALQPYAGYLEINSEASKNWLNNITRESGFIARQTMISKTADTIPWRTVPPQPILGSLLHAVLHFG